MPRYGDLLAKLAAGNTMTIGEQNELRVLGNQQEAAAATVTAWSGGTGNLGANLFQSYAPSGGFSLLPLECASIYFAAQSIANNSTTVPVGLATANATWNYGMRTDPATATIYITGIKGQSVYLFTAWWQWDHDADGYRQLTWEATDGTGGQNDKRLPTGEGDINRIVHVRRHTAGEVGYRIIVKHTAGNALSGDGLFTAVRLR